MLNPVGKKSRVEEQHQIAFVKWLRLQYPQYASLLTLGSFGENIGARRMAQLKKMGLTPGFPDLFLAVPKIKIEPNRFASGNSIDRYHGLFIEMKCHKGKVSTIQKNIHTLLIEQGYDVYIAWSWEEAKQITEEYLKL